MLANLLFSFVYHKSVVLIYGLNEFNTTDRHFYYDLDKASCNCIAPIPMDKTSEEHLRLIFRKKMPEVWQRMRCKVVKILDTYYYKEMRGEELEKALDAAITVIPKLKDFDEVSDVIN